MKKSFATIFLALCVLLLNVSCGRGDADRQTTAAINNSDEYTASETKTTDAVKETVPETSLAEFTENNNETVINHTTEDTTCDSSELDVPVISKTAPLVIDENNVDSPVVRIKNDYVVSGFENEMLLRVNKERAAYGLSALTLDKQLCYDAQLRSYEISTVNSETNENNFSHTRPDGSACFTAFYNQYMTAAENIAMGTWGYYNTQTVMDGWMDSPGHKANILNEKINKAGFACYHIGDNGYWVQLFTD